VQHLSDSLAGDEFVRTGQSDQRSVRHLRGGRLASLWSRTSVTVVCWPPCAWAWWRV